MFAKSSIACVGAALCGAVVAVVLFVAVNNFVIINGAGLLKRHGWPWSEVYFWGVAGGLFALAASLLAWHRRRVHALEVAEAALLLGFDYAPQVSRADLGDAGQLRLFSKWGSAAQLWTGRIDRIPIRMLDYTCIEAGDEGSSCSSQTVVILPGTGQLPPFELRPRHLGMRLLGMLGIQGITFDPAEAGPEAASVIEQFNAHYHLSLGLEKEMKRLAQQVQDLAAVEAVVPAEEAVHKLFTFPVLQFFAEHPGWCVECNGAQLALWRGRTIVRGSERAGFLAEALEARNGLAEPRRQQRPALVPASRPNTDPLMGVARLRATIVGLFTGFFVGALAFCYFFFVGEPFKLGGWRHLVYLGFMIPGPLLGAFLGNRFLSPSILRSLRGRQARQRQVVADSPWGQPAGSTARVQEEGDQLMITLPARGLLWGTGCFLFLWCSAWNLFMAVFTAVWLPAAVRGDVRWEGSNKLVHPVVAFLFLVPFWLVGIIALLVVLYRGRRRALLLLDSRNLWLEETTLLGVRRQEWHRPELADVQATPRSQEMFPRNTDLCLAPRQGAPARLLGWRNHNELKWLAGLIRDKWQMHSNPCQLDR
jgi:hypothetical protein